MKINKFMLLFFLLKFSRISTASLGAAVAQHAPGHSALTLRDGAAQWLQANGQTTIRLLHQEQPTRLMDNAHSGDDAG